MRRSRPDWVLLTILLAGLALRLAFALLPLQTLLALLEDDAWMVAAIARHWALGHGVTADGLTPTNGFHPLYPLTLGAIPYLVTPDLDFGFRANLLICALLSALALVPAYGLLRIVARRPMALAGLAVLSINPLLTRVTVNSMETSLALLLLLTLWWYWLARPPATPRAAAVLGVLAALAGLARLDTLLAGALLGVPLLSRELRARRFPALSLTYAAVAGALVLPYFARNLLVFGSLSPSSGRALSYLHSYRESFVFGSGLQLIAYQPAIDMGWASPAVLATATLLVVALYLTLPRPSRERLLPLAAYALILTFYYSYMQQDGKPRYYVGVGVVLTLVLTGWLDHWLAAGRLPAPGSAGEASLPVAAAPAQGAGAPSARSRLVGPALAAAAIVLNAALFAGYVLEVTRAPYLAQPAMYQAALWIDANLPPEARIGAQNSGIQQYYSGRVVLNFDGKLNHEIIPVLARRELDVYLRSRGIEYIVDLPEVSDYVEFYSASLSDAEPHPEISSLEKLRIYGRLIAARLGIGPPVDLPVREPRQVRVPFEDVTTVVQTFPLPNDASRAVTIYRLEPAFGAVAGAP